METDSRYRSAVRKRIYINCKYDNDVRMSNDKLCNISNIYISHCGIHAWNILLERSYGLDARFVDNHLKGTYQSQKRMLDSLPDVTTVIYLNL